MVHDCSHAPDLKRRRAGTAAARSSIGLLSAFGTAAVNDHDAAAAREAGSHLIVYIGTANDSPALACAALAPGDIETLFPSYERRTWRLYDELHGVRDRMLVSNVRALFCGAARPAICRWAGGEATVSFAPQSALTAISSLGVPIRAFGRRCRLVTRIVLSTPQTACTDESEDLRPSH